MSQSGQSEPVRLLQQSRLRKYVQISVHASLKFMMKLQQKQSVFSMADLVNAEMQQNCSHRLISMEDL